MSGLRDQTLAAAYRVGAVAAQAIPGFAAAPTASLIGAGLVVAMDGRREMIARHLRRVDPTLRGTRLRAAVQAAFDSYARYYIESFRLPSLSPAEVDGAFSYEGYGLVEDALAAGSGCIIALPHLGGWEWAGRWIADRGARIAVVVEPLQPREVFEWFADYRRSLGMEVIPLGPGAAAACVKALRENSVLCLLCDRDLTHDGVEVRFFGERTTLPAGPATLCLRTGAPILPTAVYFHGRTGHRAVVLPAIDATRSGNLRADVARITQDIAVALERLIRVAPTQWHLFQPNWPSDPGYAPAAAGRRPSEDS